jgi:protein O-mannosyl-transferase
MVTSSPDIPHAEVPTQEDAGRKLMLLALLVTAVAYMGTLRFAFVFDDLPQIVQNQSIRTWVSVPAFFTQHLWETVASGGLGNFYRPLFLAWFVINYKLFGLNPVGWHLTTALVHLAATYLVYRLARRITGDRFLGAVAALVFGLHPVHIETVSWVSGVSDSLLTVCFVGAFLCYLRTREASHSPLASAGTRAVVWWGASLTLFGLAVLVKEPAIVLPVLVFAYEALFPAHDVRGAYRYLSATRRTLPFVAVALAYVTVRIVVLHGFTHPLTSISTKVQMRTWPSLLWFYIRQLLWPFRISEFYETPYVSSVTWQNFGVPLLVSLAAVAGLLLWWRRSRSPVVAFSAAWLGVTLLPAFKIDTFQYGELAHDRYLYLPSVGFCILVATALSWLATSQSKVAGRRLFGQPIAVSVALLIIMAGYGAGTASQNSQWANTLLLYARGVEVAPNNMHAVAPLALELMHRERYADAIPLLERVVALQPSDWQTRFMLAQTCFLAGRYTDADRHYQEASRIEPHNAAQYYFLGLTRLKMNRPADAEAPLRRAIELLPAGRGFHEALSTVLVSRGDLDGARRELETELRNDPQNAGARAQLAALKKKNP